MNDSGINTRQYWERYFENQWADHDGPAQSRHFMAQLVSHLPAPEIDWLVRQRPSVMDWGCATGDGTALLAALLPEATVNGTDFAESAIAAARRRYPDIELICTPDGSIGRDYDVIVTSNCLEHFTDPLAVMSDHLKRCRKLYLALVPFQEHPLHEQHFAQFRLESFPE
jgi:trans-aconitate methyltransferase